MPAPASFTPSAERLLDALGPLDAEPETNDYALQHFVSALALGWDTVAEIIRDRDDGRPGFAVLFDPDDCPADFLAWAAQFVGVVMLPGLSEEQQRLRIRETGGAKRGTPSAIEGAARQFLRVSTDPRNLVPYPDFELGVTGWMGGSGGTVTAATDWSAEGSGSARFQGAAPFANIQQTTADACAVTPLETYTASYTVRIDTNTGTFYPVIYWWTAANVFISTSTGTLQASTGTRTLAITNTAPATAAKATIGAEQIAAGAVDLHLDAAMMVKGSTPLPYFDGDTPGYHWLGTPHASVTATDGPLADASVYVIERHGSAYELTVATLTAETPNANLVLRALQEQKPAGLKLTHIVVDGGIYTVLLGAHATYAELVTDFANYDAVRRDPAHT